MLAVAIFAILSISAVTALISGFNINRVAAEQAAAYQYASEGIEAMRSIKNQSFASLTNTSPTTGITRNGSNVWAYSGANNTFDASRYTRTISVSGVQRDGSGNIVASGGTLDSNTKKVTSTVTWNFNSIRTLTASLSTYFTNWKAAITSAFDALIAYGDGTTSPKYRTYSSTTSLFSAENTTVTSSSGVNFVIRTSPTKNEAILGFVTSAGVLNVQCFDGSAWTQEWTTTVGGTGTTKRFDISYETNSGDVIVLYSTNTATNNEMAYRTKLGSDTCGSANWAAATNLSSAQTTGTILWVKMAWDRRASSDSIVATWTDSNRDLSINIWNGSAWGTEPSLTDGNIGVVAGTAADSENFAVEFESLSGDVMLVWGTTVGAGANGVRYRTCTTNTNPCTWNAVTTPPTFADDATNLDISANPDTDEMLFASIGRNQSDLQLGYWSGTAWKNFANVDTSCATPIAGSKFVATGWLISGATTRGIVRYADQGSSALDWYVWNGTNFTVQTDVVQSPAPTNPSYYNVQMDPLNKTQLISAVSDNNNDLFAKKLSMTATPAFTWANTDGLSNAGAALELTLPQTIASPFSYAFRRF